MPDKDSGTPRVFLCRHGETEWSKSGAFTSHTDLDLTALGVEQVASTGSILVGTGKLIDPKNVQATFVSPRLRAKRTYGLLFGTEDWATKVNGDERVREWEYGLYEGKKTAAIRAERKERGLDVEEEWDIWRDGCEEGESPAQVMERLDQVITDIRAIHSDAMTSGRPADVVVIAHGHVLRAFAKRWLRYPMAFPLSMMLEPGGIGILSYQHHNIEEPAFLLGLGIPVGAKSGSGS